MIPVRKLGIYGGAFDPPHLAHEALSLAAIEQYQLDQLIILPTGEAWHKARSLTAAEHRIAMTRLAFADQPRATLDERETQRSGPTFTIDTLRELQTENPQDKLFLLMGQDQWSFFSQWHKYQEILEIATLLVAFRSHNILASSQKDPINQAKIPYSTIHMNASPISATQIRKLCASSQTIDHLVKPSVARYIAEHRLYLPT